MSGRAAFWITVVTVVAGFLVSLPWWLPEQQPPWTVGGREAADNVDTRIEWRGELDGQNVTLSTQVHAGLPVEGSFVKVVERNGQTVFAKSRVIRSDLLPSQERIAAELADLSKATEKQAASPALRECARPSFSQPVLRWTNEQWQIVWKRNCETRAGDVFELAFNREGRVIARREMGSHFAWENLQVEVFPKGPKRSQLEIISLNVSSNPFFLRTPTLEVTSDAGYKFADLTELGHSGPNDERFDLVQSYYYTMQALAWVKANLGTDVGGLKVRTHVGFPERSNTAFYFNREVRLGSGDGILFRNIAWDPTIVVHEAMHAVVENLTGLPFQGEAGSLQEALADSLTALHLDTPNMGEAAYLNGPFQRTLQNAMKFTDRKGKLYHDSLILSGTVWEIKERVNADTAKDLVIYLLSRLTPDSKLLDAKIHMQSWLQQCPQGEVCDRLGSILSQRGWL